ncbi:MAG: prephenate dehydrogenase/arogenate dehydrogenase family protein [Phycisphaerae bacterium]|nr:prephenate dehydrogenase/arogenate dehydrogenase family protein [Phycisphaerae bacterium]
MTATPTVERHNRIDYTAAMGKQAVQQGPFKSVSIIGMGLLGTSLGLALKHQRLADKIIGVGRVGSPSLSIARRRGAIDEAQTNPAAAAQSDLIVLATNIGVFPEILRAIANGLAEQTIITDVGSTKRQVCRWARDLLPRTARFVGSHPMAGSEKRGPEFARLDLYNNAVCFICAGKAGRLELAAQRVEWMWRQVGMRTLRIRPQAHDRWVAAISHTPHAAAAALVNLIHADAANLLRAAAGGFMDTTRVASGDVDMWTDIFLTNRRAAGKSIRALVQLLQGFERALRHDDQTAVRQFLQQAKAIRDQLPPRHGGG